MIYLCEHTILIDLYNMKNQNHRRYFVNLAIKVLFAYMLDMHKFLIIFLYIDGGVCIYVCCNIYVHIKYEIIHIICMRIFDSLNNSEFL